MPNNEGEKPKPKIDANEALKGVQDMIAGIVRRHAHDFGEHDKEDLTQKAMMWLWEKSLPRFDPEQYPNTKLSTFLHACTENFVRQEVRSMRRLRDGKGRKIVFVDHHTLMTGLRDMGGSLVGSEIERAADMFRKQARRYLTPTQCKVFYAMTDNPQLLRKDLSKLLGYKLTSSLSTIIRRIRERAREVGHADMRMVEGEE